MRQVSSTENSSQRGYSYCPQRSIFPAAETLSPKGVSGSTLQHPLQWMTCVVGKRLSKGFLGTRVS